MEKREMIEQMIIHFADGNRSAFARTLGVIPQVVTNWITRDTINAELCFQRLQGISAEWLLSNGEGEMLVEVDKQIDIANVEVLKERITMQEKQIEMQERQIATLERLVAVLEHDTPKKSNVV